MIGCMESVSGGCVGASCFDVFADPGFAESVCIMCAPVGVRCSGGWEANSLPRGGPGELGCCGQSPCWLVPCTVASEWPLAQCRAQCRLVLRSPLGVTAMLPNALDMAGALGRPMPGSWHRILVLLPSPSSWGTMLREGVLAVLPRFFLFLHPARHLSPPCRLPA